MQTPHLTSLLKVNHVLVALFLIHNVNLTFSDLLLVRTSCNLHVHPLPHLRPLELRSDLVLEHEDVPVLFEVPIDILERAVRRLGIEQVGRGDETGTDDGPDDPEAVAEVRDSRRCNLGDHVVHDPVGGHGEGGPLGPKADVVDLGRIEPGHSQDAHTETRKKEEKPGRRDGAHGGRIRLAGLGQAQRDADDGPACRAGESRDHHDSPAAVAFDHEPC